MIRPALPALLLAVAAPAAAADLRPLCTTRPSLGSSACTVDPGHVLIETGLGDWEKDANRDTRTDTILAGDALARLGLGDTTELQLGWTAFGHVRERDRATGQVDRSTNTGDVIVALRQNLRNPDGQGFSYGVQPFVTLPTGGGMVGAGTWGAGIMLPVGYTLAHGVSLQFTGEVDARPDEDGNGRHLAFSGIWGIGFDVTDTVSMTAEIAENDDRTRGERYLGTLAALSVGWQPGDDLQWDAGAVAGLDHNSPDIRLFFGVSRRF